MQRTVYTVSNETKFFDVECAFGRAYDLKELRRLLGRIIGKRVKNFEVFRFDGGIRVKAELRSHTTVDFQGIQEEFLDHRGIILHDPLEEDVVEVLEEIVTSPVDIPVTTIEIAAQQPAASFVQTLRLPMRHPSAA